MTDLSEDRSTPRSAELGSQEPPFQPRHARAIRVGSFGLIVAIVFGLLLWARFVVITGHPRTAIAQPTVQQSPAQAQAEGALSQP